MILHLENTLLYAKLLYIWGKMIFSCHYNFTEKNNSKLPKNEPVYMCNESWCVGLGQEGRLSVWEKGKLFEIP